jgi:ribosomal protein L37AE/L43A
VPARGQDLGRTGSDYVRVREVRSLTDERHTCPECGAEDPCTGLSCGNGHGCERCGARWTGPGRPTVAGILRELSDVEREVHLSRRRIRG